MVMKNVNLQQIEIKPMNVYNFFYLKFLKNDNDLRPRNNFC